MTKATAYSDQTAWSDTYLSDPTIVEACGPFDLDPCCPPRMPWRTAETMCQEDFCDGLKVDWRPFGRVWMNPPYRGTLPWARKFAEHKSGVALLNGRSPETRATQTIMREASALWLPQGRLRFFRPDGTEWPQKWFPSLLIGMGEEDAARLEQAKEKFGGVVWRRP